MEEKTEVRQEESGREKGEILVGKVEAGSETIIGLTFRVASNGQVFLKGDEALEAEEAVRETQGR